MAILSEYEEQPESVKKPFNAVLDCADPLGFLQTAFEFVACETDLFKKDSVIKDVNGLVRSVKEKLDADERKRKVKAVPASSNGGAAVKTDNKRVKEDSSSSGSAVKESTDQKIEDSNDDDKKGLREKGRGVAAPAVSGAAGQALKWSRPGFRGLCERFEIDELWQPMYPGNGKKVTDVPAGKIVLYAEYFTSCNFRLPVTKFLVELLNFYGVHISQVHAMGMCRIRHFEFSCWAQDLVPAPSMFNVFYKATFLKGFLSFKKRPSVKAHAMEAPSSFHSWPERFFFIHAGVIPVEMSFRPADQPFEDVPLIAYADEAWYEKLVSHPVKIDEIPEGALVAVGMSRLWDDARRFPVFTINGQDSEMYGVLTDAPGGQLMSRVLKEGEPAVLDRYADNFVFPVVLTHVSPPESTGGDISSKAMIVAAARDAPIREAAGAEAQAKQAAPEPSLVEEVEPEVHVKRKRSAADLPSPKKKKVSLVDSIKKAEEKTLADAAKKAAVSAVDVDSRAEHQKMEAQMRRLAVEQKKAAEAAENGRETTAEREVAAKKAAEVAEKEREAATEREMTAKKAAEKAAGKRIAEKSVEAVGHKSSSAAVIVGAAVTSGPRGVLSSPRSDPTSPCGVQDTQSSAPQTEKTCPVYRPNWRLAENVLFRREDVCQEFVSLAVPSGEQAFQHSRPLQDLHANGALAMATPFAMYSEMDCELRMLRSEQSDIAKLKRKLDEERATLDEEKRQHGDVVQKLKWDLVDAHEAVKKAQEEAKTLREQYKKASHDWQMACEKTNSRIATLQETNRDLGARIKGLNQEVVNKDHALGAKDVDLAARDREIAELKAKLAASENQRVEVLQSVTDLEQQVTMLAKEAAVLREDRRWLVAEAIPTTVEIVKNGSEFQDMLGALLSASKLAGREEGFSEGYSFAAAGRPQTEFLLYGVDCAAALVQKVEEFDVMQFPILEFIMAQAGAEDLRPLRARYEVERAEGEEEQVDYEPSG